ncbi:hypothetical protein N172_16155 [Pantoea dispersa EGD-AAK13]|nr:hypothetical protein N172_16155 [Pantoea dispersa EGD-AAK13]
MQQVPLVLVAKYTTEQRVRHLSAAGGAGHY